MSAYRPSSGARVASLVLRPRSVGGGLRLLLHGGLLPENVGTVRFVCDVNENQGLHAQVIVFRRGVRVPVGELAPELRIALERCFVRLLHRLRLFKVGDAIPPTVWEWSAQSDALTRLAEPAPTDDISGGNACRQEYPFPSGHVRTGIRGHTSAPM